VPGPSVCVITEVAHQDEQARHCVKGVSKVRAREMAVSFMLYVVVAPPPIRIAVLVPLLLWQADEAIAGSQDFEFGEARKPLSDRRAVTVDVDRAHRQLVFLTKHFA
jgi:hypothetical protein